MRMCVAEVIVDTLRGLGLSYPEIDAERRAGLSQMRKRLEGD
jgi:hypothetical protein